jgi:glycosyltransferase involved in cell wall biosynthesis
MNARQPFLSVIISTRNRKERLRRCLSSLAAHSYPRDRWELIVVEDGDQEPLDEMMLSFRDRLPLRWFRVPHAGCGGAKNAGASQARGHYLVFTDDDCLFCPDWLSRYEEHFERAGHCLVAGCAVNPRKANPYSDASQELVNYLLERSNAAPHEATLAIGNNFGVPAQGFRELGGFDPCYFPMGGEDRDFAACWVAAGWRIVYAPDIVVEHAQVLTFWSLLRQQYYYGRGALIFHRLEARRRGRWVRLPSPAFYFSLFLRPWHVGAGRRAALMCLLFLWAQFAHFAGYLGAFSTAHRDNQERIRRAIATPAAVDLSKFLREESQGEPSAASQ